MNLASGISQHLNLVLGKHEALINDNMVYGTETVLEYVESQFYYSSDGTTSNNAGMLFLNIFLDDTVKKTKR